MVKIKEKNIKRAAKFYEAVCKENERLFRQSSFDEKNESLRNDSFYYEGAADYIWQLIKILKLEDEINKYYE